MYFKRLNNKYSRQMLDLKTQPQPFNTETVNSITISKKEQIDLLAVRSYGSGNEGMFFKIAYKNADQLLAWDLDNRYINVMLIPSTGEYV